METFIDLVFLLVGFSLGTLVKIGYDYYHNWLKEQVKLKEDMEEVLYKFKRIEEDKKIKVEVN